MKQTTNLNETQKRQLKQQMILLFFLFLMGWPTVGRAIDDTEFATPGARYTGDIRRIYIKESGNYYFDNVYGGAVIAYASNLTIHLYFTGQNSMTAARFGAGGNGNGAIDFEGQKKENFRNNTIYMHGDENTSWTGYSVSAYPSIRMCPGGPSELIIDGAMTVTTQRASNAGGTNYPGIYAGDDGGTGRVTLKNGANVFMDDVAGSAGKPTVTVENYAQWYSNNVNPSYATQQVAKFNVKDYIFKPDKPVSFNMYNKSGALLCSGKIRNSIRDGSNAYTFYYKSTYDYDYFTIDNIGSPTDKATSVYMGIASDNSYYYSTLSGTFSSPTLKLRTNGYTHSGTMVAGADMTFDGQGYKMISNGFKFKGNYPLKLRNIQCSGAIKVEGKVYVDINGPGNLSSWSVTNTAGKPIYYSHIQLPTGISIKSITQSDGTSITDYVQDGQNVYMWLTSAVPALTVKTSGLVYYSEATTVTAHNTRIPLLGAAAEVGGNSYPTLSEAFTNAGSGKTIKLLRDYSQPASTSLNVGLSSGQMATFDLNGKILTLGSNVSMSSGSGTLHLVDNGGGVGKIIGTVTITGKMYTKLDNSKLPTVLKNNKAVYYCTATLSSSDAVSSVTIPGGSSVADYIQTGPELYMWLSNPSPILTIKTGGAGLIYYSEEKTISAHNTIIPLTKPAAQINTTYYRTLLEAFTAATQGQTIKLQRNYTQAGSESLRFSLALNQQGTLDLNGYTLTLSGTGSISSGNGTLLLIDGTGGSAGKITGTYAMSGKLYTKLLARAGAVLKNNQPVFYCTATLPSGETVESVTTTGNTPITEYIQTGTEFYMWSTGPIPALVIKTNGNQVHLSKSTTHNMNGTNIVIIRAAAQIESVYYQTLSEAFTAINATDQTVKMMYDYVQPDNGALTLSLTGGQKTTLDLNGRTLSFAGTNTSISSGAGTLQLIDAAGNLGRITGTYKMTGKYYTKLGNNVGTVMKNGKQAYYCIATLLPGATIDPASLPNTDYIQTDTELYMWFPSAVPAQTIKTTSVTPDLVYLLKAQTLNTQGTTINLARAVGLIGSVNYYATLKEAFAATTAGGTVKLVYSFTQTGSETLAFPLSLASQKVTFDLNGKTLDFSGLNTTISSGTGTLMLVDGEGGGGTSGSFTLNGSLYTELDAAKLGGVQMAGKFVYRTWMPGIPLWTGREYVNYRVGQQGDLCRALMQNSSGPCCWLPEGTAQQLWVLDGNDPVATTIATINAAHSNSINTFDPWVDIRYGDVVVTPGSSQTVKYGKYTATTAGNDNKKRLVIRGTAVANEGKNNSVSVTGGTGTAYLTLNNVTVSPAKKAAFSIESFTDIELYGDNRLTGGYNVSTPCPAIQIMNGAQLTWNNCLEGHGRLYVNGGAYSATNSPAIQATAGTTMIVQGASLIARRSDTAGNQTAARSIQGGTQKILAGSVDALYVTNEGLDLNPTNDAGSLVYKIAVTTGLDPKQTYLCSYAGSSPTVFNTLPDAAGKVYFWQCGQALSDPKTSVTLTHPVSYEKTVIEVAKVDVHDRNVAPIVIEMTNQATQVVNSFGNLQDAFIAMQGGTPEAPARYSLSQLTHINNLRTTQKTPANTHVTLDLQNFEIGAQNGSEVAFDASASGAYLNVNGKGNIKNSFRIAGDVFIDGVVPLTDAVVMLDGNAVFRTLVKDLPVGENNTYTYSYGQRQNVPFNLHNGLACLWLPDYGRSEELRFVVNGSGGSSTDYTAGAITTVTQRTEAIPASPVGVVARVTYKDGSINQTFNTLKEAFEHARKASVDNHYADVEVRLLTGVSISGTITAAGSFTLCLEGKNITSASGALLVIENDARITLSDETVGMKGSLDTDISLKTGGRLFIPGFIRLKGIVTKVNSSTEYWRTMVNTRYLPEQVSEITYKGIVDATYSVINNEACLWLPVNKESKTEYIFRVGVTDYKVSGYIISANSHDNDMTIGGSNKAARIGLTEYGTVEEALNIAADGETVELLKTSSLNADLKLIGRKVNLELGKYGLTASTPVASTLTVGKDAQLILDSKTGTGEVKTPIQLEDGGLLYAGQGVTGDHMGEVKDNGSKQLYRLLVTNLPTIIPTGEHDYLFKNSDEAEVSAGQFMVRQEVACLWLPSTVAGKLVFQLGAQAYTTENVTVNADHFNIETYGVSDVAQIKNGKKYRKLHEALNDAAGKTVVLLKNAALESAVVINGSVVLETGEYGITAQNAASFTVNSTGNLRITGNGNVSANFTIMAATANSTYSNANLQIDNEVNLLATSLINLEGRRVYRAGVSGLPFSGNVKYTYNKNQTGQVRSSDKGNLCLWLDAVGSPANFEAEVGKVTYLATLVNVVGGTHANPILVTQVEGVADIGGTLYDTLHEAFTAVPAGEEVKLRKEVSAQNGLLKATNGNVILSLEGNQLAAAPEGFMLDAGAHQLVLRNGTLAGAISVGGNVYADGDVIMTNANITQGVKTVWRTLVSLPEGTTSFDYQTGDINVKGCTNIKDNIACLWLPSSNVARSFILVAGNTEYALNNIIIASTHGNELNVMAGNDPVAQVLDKTFASLASALDEGMATGTPVVLMKPINLSSVQTIKSDLTLDLGAFNITSGNGGFTVAEGKTLTLKATGGMLLGTLRLSGLGHIFASSSVRIAGIVLDGEGREVYRTLIKMGADASVASRCLWLQPVTTEYDEILSVGITNYQAAIPVGLSNHNTVLTAYKQFQLSGLLNWQPAYAQANLELMPNALLSIPDNINGEIHRLTLHDGAYVKFAGESQVRASEGIRYVRSFPANVWKSVALPFNTTRITTVDDTGVASLINPAYGAGTAGHFWLRTMDMNGKMQTVNSADMTANVSYLMAVPDELANPITFISGPNQLMRRAKELAVKPVSGFASYANGTLDKIEVEEPCYVLAADGMTYTRMQTATISPFRGYLLADATTTTITPELRLGTTTDSETIGWPGSNALRIYTLPGRVVVEAQQPTQVWIYTASGYCVRALKVAAGRTEIPLETSFYIINNTKVWVK